ncbi:hypothetical protein DPEC_G00335720 [Dallia pectoralis]|uniref:Uncharacterized protein n=1 Tax=Dallia pectoralis TaxID=75939 RepID=A0ACC2F705_DALPE|nr:hypothetical protein DPEC_G00335720 [Dallia pectoralis]
MNSKGCHLLVSPSGIPPSLGVITGQHAPSIGMPVRTTLTTGCRATLSPATSGGRGRVGGVHRSQNPLSSGKNFGSSLVLPTLSLCGQVLANGKQTNLFGLSQMSGQQLPPNNAAEANHGTVSHFPDSGVKGYQISVSRMQMLGQQACENLRVTSSPMVVQRLGPVSPVTAQAYASVPLVPDGPQPTHGQVVPYTEARWVSL